MVSYYICMTMAKTLVEDYLYMTDTAMALKHAFAHTNKELAKINEKKVFLLSFLSQKLK